MRWAYLGYVAMFAQLIVALWLGHRHKIRREEEYSHRLKQEVDGALQDLKWYGEPQDNDIAAYHERIPPQVEAAVKARRDRLSKHDKLVKTIGIPLKRKPGAPDVKPIKVERKLVRPLPPPPKSGLKSEPGILDEQYEHILGVIRHEGRSFETTPATFSVHDEEDLEISSSLT